MPPVDCLAPPQPINSFLVGCLNYCLQGTSVRVVLHQSPPLQPTLRSCGRVLKWLRYFSSQLVLLLLQRDRKHEVECECEMVSKCQLRPWPYSSRLLELVWMCFYSLWKWGFSCSTNGRIGLSPDYVDCWIQNGCCILSMRFSVLWTHVSLVFVLGVAPIYIPVR